jgi:predicted DNA-binding WGR domain protein
MSSLRHKRFELRRAPRACFYTMTLEPVRQLRLDGVKPPVVELVLRYGRLGTLGHELRFPFDDEERALERWGEVATRRRRRGYEEVLK